MTKQSLIRLYRPEKVPDHILQQVEDLIENLAINSSKVCEGYPENIVLSAFNRLHAEIVCAFIAESSLEEAAKTEAIGLMRNIEHISGQQFFETDPEES